MSGHIPSEIIATDWGDRWEDLADAPPLVPRRKTTQVTLRIGASSLVRLKAVAAARSLPYHALARAWIIDGLRSGATPGPQSGDGPPRSKQLNLKVDHDQLDTLKKQADILRIPYHALARQYIEAGLEREERTLEVRQA